MDDQFLAEESCETGENSFSFFSSIIRGVDVHDVAEWDADEEIDQAAGEISDFAPGGTVAMGLHPMAMEFFPLLAGLVRFDNGRYAATRLARRGHH